MSRYPGSAAIRQKGEGGRVYKQTSLRMPPALYDSLIAASTSSGRTVNAEMIHCLSIALGTDLGDQDEGTPSPVERMASDISELLEIARWFKTNALSA